jgi:hypothetical protein
MTISKGDTVKAFHPRMFGVVKTGTVVGIGPKWARIDFGELLGGVFHVPRAHIVEVELRP